MPERETDNSPVLFAAVPIDFYVPFKTLKPGLGNVHTECPLFLLVEEGYCGGPSGAYS